MKSVFKLLKVLTVLSIFLLVIAFILTRIRKPYSEIMVVEAGDELFSAAYFFNNIEDGAYYLTDIKDIELNHVCENDIKIKLNGLVYNVKLKVKDTIPPKITGATDVTGYVGEGVLPEDFIEGVVDNTEVYYEYASPPDFYTEGDTLVTINVIDEGGNVANVTRHLTIVRDDEPPKIIGACDRSVRINERIIYRDEVYVTDNRPGATLEVDNSNVDVTREGDYTVTYKATDVSGNVTTTSVCFSVIDMPFENVSEEILEAKFKEVYDSIIDDAMTDREKVFAIYQYDCGIKYVPTSDKTDYRQNAYRGMVTGEGDCYTNYSIARVLFEMAGFENLCVVLKDKSHTYNLVDFGEGFLIFDACRIKGFDIETFLPSYKELLTDPRYNNLGIENIDTSLYPV